MSISRRTFIAGIAALTVGVLIKGRHKSRIPRLEELKESILKHGLIRPIMVDKNLKLISGYRRLEACKELGFTRIQCAIVHEDSRGLLLDLENGPISIDKIIVDSSFNLRMK